MPYDSHVVQSSLAEGIPGVQREGYRGGKKMAYKSLAQVTI